MKYLFVALLIAAPLSAQQQVTIPPPDINVNLPPLEITNQINVMTDSAMIANLVENNRLLREMLLEERECDTCGAGSSRTMKVAVGVLIPVLVWIALELRGIKNKDDVHNVNNTINLPEKRKHDDDNDSESE